MVAVALLERMLCCGVFFLIANAALLAWFEWHHSAFGSDPKLPYNAGRRMSLFRQRASPHQPALNVPPPLPTPPPPSAPPQPPSDPFVRPETPALPKPMTRMEARPRQSPLSHIYRGNARDPTRGQGAAPHYQHDRAMMDLPAPIRVPTPADCPAPLRATARFFAISLYSRGFEEKKERLLASCDAVGVCCSPSLVPPDAFVPSSGSDTLEGASGNAFRLRMIGARPMHQQYTRVAAMRRGRRA